MTTPWRSIAESILPTPGAAEPLPMAAAMESPCLSCSTSPCCTHLPLHTFRVTNLVELDHALYLLNFEHIELAISASGEWSAYYAYPCRFLNRSTFECSVHGTPGQPEICKNYNPYSCWYRRVFTVGQGDELVRLDRARLELLVQHIEFDESRRITSVPAWEALVAMMEGFDDRPAEQGSDPTPGDPALEAWERAVLGQDESAPEATDRPLSFGELTDPCDGCAAYCCTSLIFPQAVPSQIASLDYLRFCLGFPGVQLGVSDGGWSIIVRTTCRHLEGSRCAVFGKESRPLICRYYDAWKCDYKPQFGRPRPNSFMRLRLEQLQWLADSLPYAPDGTIVAMPAMEELRRAIEVRWRERGGLELIPLAVQE